jgi:hypothetical protein
VKCPSCGVLKKKRSNGNKLCISCENKTRPFAHPKGNKKRELKPYDDLAKSQRNVRRKMAVDALAELQFPAASLQPVIPPTEVIHLSTAVREQMRTVKSIHMPSEKVIIALKQQLAHTHGTATESCSEGDLILAYLTDPLLFLRLITADSDYIIIGGDKGGDTTKLGVSYTNKKGVEEFSAIVITNQEDNYESLNKLVSHSLFHFTGESTQFKNIWEFFQYLIDHPFNRHQKVLLNGDWPFLNSILGLQSPACLQPCPICIVDKKNFLVPAPRRIIYPCAGIYSPNTPLIIIDSTQILPTPLHVFLGICNRILDEILPHLIDKQKLAQAKKSSKSTYSYGAGGVTNVHELNGPELSKFLKHEWEFIEDEKSIQLFHWMNELHKYLLHKQEWSDEEINEFQLVVNTIQSQWKKFTGQKPFPKLHMLTHCHEFARRYRVLGKCSEARIESFHAIFNHSTLHTHRNQGKHLEEKLRRSLADMALRNIQVLL